MRTSTFAEMAETVTPENIPDFFHGLRNRPEPHCLEYEALIIQSAAETLNLSPWELFLSYQESAGESLPQLTEIVWRLSFPQFFNCLETKPEPKMATIIDFPVIPKPDGQVVRTKSYIDDDGNRKWIKVKPPKANGRISLKKNVIQFTPNQAQEKVIAK